MLRLLVFLLPLGLDTLGIAVSLGIKSHSSLKTDHNHLVPAWLQSALLFSCAEMLMPLIGLGIGYVASLALSDIMHIVGPLILIAVGLWELIEESRERLQKRRVKQGIGDQKSLAMLQPQVEQAPLARQLLLAMSVSLDELAIGFSLGAITSSIPGARGISPLVLCLLIGLQSFLLTIIGLTLGRVLSTRLKPVKEWSELLSAVLLIGLGIWIFFM